MKRKKEDYLVIVFALILVIIVFTLIYISIVNNEKTTVLPTPTPQPSPTRATTNGKPTLLYNVEKQNKLLEYVRKREPLTNNDMVAKANILSTLPQNQKSGVLMESKNIKIDYTASADLFQVEILTTDIQAAKNEANIWFRARGISQKAICTMPVGFYLNFDIANEIRNTDIIFDPLGNGC